MKKEDIVFLTQGEKELNYKGTIVLAIARVN